MKTKFEDIIEKCKYIGEYKNCDKCIASEKECLYILSRMVKEKLNKKGIEQ